MTKEKHIIKSSVGFTLVELLIVLVISSVISMALFSSYKYQQDSQINQDEVVRMQQNLRASSYYLTTELRMAGFDPTGKADAGITDASPGAFTFTQDLNEDGKIGTDEDITYSLKYNDGGTVKDADDDDDGVLNAGLKFASLYREGQPVADNLNGVEFLYTLKSGTQTTTPGASQYDDIRSVTVSILAQTNEVYEDKKHTNTMIYESHALEIGEVGTIWGSPYNDGNRRRLLTMNINLRNMGL